MTPSLRDDREGGLGRTEFENEFEDEFEDEPVVRPFMVTGGRTHTSLPIEAMVVDTQGGGAVLPLGDEYRVLYRLCAEPQAVPSCPPAPPCRSVWYGYSSATS